MSATVCSRQYYPGHNLISDVELTPNLGPTEGGCVQQTGTPSKWSILVSLIKIRSFGDLVLAPVVTLTAPWGMGRTWGYLRVSLRLSRTWVVGARQTVTEGPTRNCFQANFTPQQDLEQKSELCRAFPHLGGP